MSGKSVVIVAAKRNFALAKSLQIQLTERGLQAVAWSEDKYAQMDPTKLPQRTVFIEDSKSMKQVQSTLNYPFSYEGMQIGIRSKTAVINVDQTRFDADHRDQLALAFPISADQELRRAVDNENPTLKNVENAATSVRKATSSVRNKVGGFFRNHKGNTTAATTLSVGAFVTTQIWLTAMGIANISKNHLINISDIALLYVFSEYYADDFASEDTQTYVQTEKVLADIAKQRESVPAAEGNETANGEDTKGSTDDTI